MAIVGAVAFSEFFVLTLYLQDVLHYSAVQSGVAFARLRADGRRHVERRPGRSSDASGCGPTLTTGLLALGRVGRVADAAAGATGSYFWDLFPAFVLGGAGMGLSFVPVTIAGLTRGASAPTRASPPGSINTSRQIGGAIGIAAVSAIAATSTSNYADAHAGVAATSASRSTTASRPRSTCSPGCWSSAR